MQAGHDDRTEGRRIFYALSHPELLDVLASAEKLPAATGCRVARCPADGTPTDSFPIAGVTTDSLPIAGVPTGVDR